MRPVLAAAALAALSMGALAACTDDDPLRLSDGESAAFSVRPQLNRFGAADMLPINLVRLTVVSLPDSAQVIEPVEVPVEPSDPTWNLHLDVPLIGGQPLEVIVFVELINDTEGVRTIEWSGIAGPFSLEPGGSADAPTVDMFRGSIANLAITAVSIAGADTTTEGALLVLRASATGASSPQFFWSSLDPTVVALTTAGLDSASFLPLAPGVARIVVEAGPRADTLEVEVAARVTALALSGGVDTLTALLATTTFAAAALDARADTVQGVPFTWSSSDSLIARSLGGGVFEARARGTVTITATTSRAPGLSVTAQLSVRQDVDTIVVAAATDTVAAGVALVLGATARDANAQPIAGAPVAWSSNDTTIVAIDSVTPSSAYLSGRGLGTTTVRAALDGKSTSVGVTVVAGAVASVVVSPSSLSFAALAQSACVSASVTDVEGNPTGSAVAWSSSDGNIAAVDGSGCVTAVANGDAFVIATSGGVADSASVLVEQVATSVVVGLADPEIEAGGSTIASGIARDAGGAAIAGAAFTWSSSDGAVATVAADGIVSAVGVGSAWIRGAHGALADSVLLTAVAGQPATLSIVSGDGQTGTVGSQLGDSLVVLVTDSLGNPVPGARVDFATASGSISPPSLATDAQGRAIAYWTLGTGAGAVSASAVSVADTVVFRATAAAGPVASVDVQPDTLAFSALAQTQPLTAGAVDAFGNPTAGATTWTSRNTGVATVDATGLVTSVRNGTTYVVAAVDGVPDSAYVSVLVPAPAPATIAWTGEASSDWFDASNWNTGALPGANDTVHVSAAAPFQPVLSANDSIAGVIVEDGASLTLNATTLTVENHVDAGHTISGTGTLRLRGGSISGAVPNLELAGGSAITTADTVTVTGDVTFVEPFTELHVTMPLLVSGEVVVAPEQAFLYVGDSLDVAGALQVGGGSGAVAPLQVVGTVVVGDSLLTTTNGRVEVVDPAARVVVRGNARFESTYTTNGFLTTGTIVVGGDLRANGAALHATGTRVELNAAVDQRIGLADAGSLPTQARLHDMDVRKAGGIVYLESDAYLAGSLTENAGYPVFDTAQAHTLTVAGNVDLVGALQADSLRVAGTLAVGGALDVTTIEFTGSSQTIPATLAYQNVLVSGNGTWSSPGGAIAGNAAVTGSLLLAGDLDVAGITTVAGSVQLNGNRLGTTSLDVVLGGVALSNVNDTLAVRGGSADFRLPSQSILSAGHVVVETGGNFTSDGKAFRSTGTALVMYGDTLFMSDAGPGALQGALSTLYLGRPATFTVADSVYVSGDLIDLDSSAVVDRGQFESGWYGEIRVEGSIQTPRTGYSFQKLRLGGALDYDFGASDVDSTQFTGVGQTIPVVDALFQPLSHGTIIVTGSDVHLGSDTDFLDLSSDVVVRGAGSRLTVHSNDNGFTGSLNITEGDASTRVVIHDAISVRDSTVIAAGALDLTGTSLTLNDNGFAPTALRTTGTGVVLLDEALDRLFVANGDARFDGGNTGVLSGGFIEMADSTGFYSVGDAFRATGTVLVHRGDTISMKNAGPIPGQGQLAILRYESPNLDVIDSLYIAFDLEDSFGAMLHDPVGTALVTVAGDARVDSSQVVLGHLKLGGDLVVTTLTNFVVDTAQFFGSGQFVPVEVSGVPIGYNVMLITGSPVNIGSAFENLAALSSTDLIVRGSGAQANLFSSGRGGPRSLVMQGGAARVLLGNSNVDVADSVHVASGILDLNGRQLSVNTAGAPVALRTTGTGTIEMNQAADQLLIGAGDVVFEGGSTNGMLTAGSITLSSSGDTTTFRATGAAFHSTGTRARFDVDSIVIVNGGPGATQARLHTLEFGTQTGPFFAQQLAGHLVVGDSLIDYIGAGSAIVGAPGAQLTVLGRFRSSIGRYDIPRVTAYQNLEGSPSSVIDTLELAGNGQVVGGHSIPMDSTVVYVTGPGVTFDVAFTDTIAQDLYVKGGVALLTGGGTFFVTDSLTVDGGTFDLNGQTLYVGDDFALDGALATVNGGVLVSRLPGFLTLRGSADFRGGTTDGLLTDGFFSLRGDFHAQDGAFQASGNHTTWFDFTSNNVKLSMPTGGPYRSGGDHFNHLGLSTGDTIQLSTDIWAVGDVQDNSDAPFTFVLGEGTTLHADGYSITSGIAVSDVTLELDASIQPERDGGVAMSNVDFVRYGLGGTRIRMIHPGLLGSATIQISGPDFALSEGDPGAYVEAIDSDGEANPDTLNVEVYFARTGGEPSDIADPSRLVAENGAAITTRSP